MNEERPPSLRRRHAHGSGHIETWQDVFADDARREILSHLTEEGQRVELRALVDLFDAVPEGSAASRPGSSDRESIRSWLLTEHVFPMEAFGVVDLDADAETVRIADGVAVCATTDEE